MRKGVLERIQEKIFVAPDGCWLWTASVCGGGYGRIAIGSGKYKRAHRAYYELIIGKVPDGLVLDHKCKKRSCVNPYHLEAVTQKENVWRGNMVKNICKHGKPMYGCSNECRKEYQKNWRIKNKKNGD